MAYTPSSRSVTKRLRESGFKMDAVVAQGHGCIVVGFPNPHGEITTESKQAAIVAGEVLGWPMVPTENGTFFLEYPRFLRRG